MIDWARISELKEEFGEDDFAEVVTLFFAEVETAVDALPQADDRAAALHFIKGCALNLGLSELAQLCQSEAPDGQITDALSSSREALAKGQIKPEADAPQPKRHKEGQAL